MNNTTHEVRIANWRSIIKQCQARPEGQSAKQWLEDNGIPRENYYYWQCKVRQETYALISSKMTLTTEAEPVDFAKLPIISPKGDGWSFSPDAVIRKGQTIRCLSGIEPDRVDQ